MLLVELASLPFAKAYAEGHKAYPQIYTRLSGPRRLNS